ncbi:hypothetical protein EOA23_08465 [Mesorhizobium sp. M2A.F.Ca.ET.042.01.1.1]|uniref:hypothetical protein n=1 Tax=Mesorhizobium sp. M2A.F.Ca.ET.042.01.1.1 TaxID=2496745 RepID=UPI000FCC024F|nr:hypothetical protein [Mesorhizobium sp. M2A.F.Ca.ET.042.01.1.1]RUX33042.1 hypothetical protein EOA23_08465 [Mesorhizobium sp. M2A.F.Ca.ET.042.01.1.1]
MTTPSETNRSGPYNGNGVTTVFDYEFRIVDENHIKAIRADLSGVETVLTIDADYVVSDVGNPAGGQVALTAPLTTGYTLTFLRNVPFTQETDLENQGPYYAETVERAFDLSAMRDQQLQEQISRALLIPPSEDPAQLDGLVGDILRLADSANEIDAVAAHVDAVQSAADNMAAIIAAPAQAAAAGNSATAAAGSAAAAAASAASVPPTVATRAALKALDTTNIKSAYLTEPNRFGQWLWTTGDFSAVIAADTSEAIAIKANAIAANLGAWRRVLPKRELTPSMYGAISGGDPAANATAINAMIAFVRQTFDTGQWDFTYELDFEGIRWNVSAAINCTLIRQPGLVLKNGGLTSTAAGAIVLDMAGTNTPTFRAFNIHGDDATPPAVGLLLSRALSGGSFGGVTNCDIDGLTIDGSFSKAAYINFAAEVSSDRGVNISNRHRSVAAKGAVFCGHAGTLDDYCGGVASSFVTIPVAADGSQSNVVHNLSGGFCVMRNAYNPPAVTGITKANPAVVSHLPADLVASGFQNGDKVFYHDIGGMTQLNGNVYTVANINLGAGTFELSGVNSTGFSTFTAGGRSWNQTGAALVVGQCDGLVARASYLLSYGSEPVIIDTKNGGGPRMLDLECHLEAQPPASVLLGLPSAGTAVLQGVRLHNLSANQNFSDAVIREDAGAGNVRIDDLDLKIYNMGVAPPNKVFKTPAKWTIKRGRIAVPLQAALNTSPAAFTEYTVEEVAFDRTPIVVRYGMVDFRNDTSGSAALRAVAYDDSANHGPQIDTTRISASPAANDGLGVYRFVGYNSSLAATAFAQLRGRILVETAGAESGRLEFVTISGGATGISGYAQGTLINAAGSFTVAGTQVVGPRATGWTAGTGTANKGAFAAYAGATMSAAYSQTEAQATNNAARDASQRIKAVEDALRTHGLIN